MRRRIVISVLLAATVLMLTSCGATDKQAYIEENNAIQEEVAADISKLSSSDEKSIDTAIAKLDVAIKKFNKLDVPEDYAKDHKQLVGAVEDLRDSMVDLKAAVKAKDPSKLNAISKDINEAQQQYNEAVDAMNADRT